MKKTILQKLFYFIEPQIEKFALRHADKFIVENTRAKKLISLYGANPNNIKIAPYYIQDYFLIGNNPTFNKKNDYFQIGYTGRFREYDVLIPIINAISLLREKNYRVRLNLIGDGPNRKNIEKLVYKKGLNENIIFFGSRPHKEVSNLINEYHCLLLPMLNKLCPSTIAIKVLEGVMKGKIIITTNSGNNPSLFLEHKDLILNTATTESIAQKIKIVIENYDKYKSIAEELSRHNLKLRSRIIYQEKIKELLIETIS
ncbi:MAG: glycosyltransferase family 4 protein [Promethearchaeota archaeon]